MKSALMLVLFFAASVAFASDSIGVVKAVKGDVQLTGENGSAKALAVGDQIHEQDRIATDQTSFAVIQFESGDKIQIFSQTRLSVQEYNRSQIGRRAIFNLLKGKIRSQVKQNFDGKAGRYQILTQGVSAEVRGTADFFLSHDKSSHVVTRAEVLDGDLELNERMGEKSVRVARGQLVTFVLSDAALTRDAVWINSPEKGFFNPVRKLSLVEFQSLYKTDLDDKADSGKALKIEKAAPPPMICKKPSARFNQCTWRCVNNPKKAKTCEAEKPNVSCIRFRCNANGDWAEETKLPAGAADKCKAKGDVVDVCDY